MNSLRFTKFICLALVQIVMLLLAGLNMAQASGSQDSKPLDGVTFAVHPGRLFVPIKEFGKALGQDIDEEGESGDLTIGGHPIDDFRYLFDGTGLMPVGETRGWGATVSWDETAHIATVQYNNQSVQIREGGKSVIVDKSSQSLMAYQGPRLVIATHVSTGREGHGTPNGNFSAGPAKERMHRSRLYHFAPMPWSVQVAGNVFIHGYTSVPNSPASHGCIRVPLNHGNPAHYFFNWVDIGTPVTIQGTWSYRYASHHRHHSRYATRWRRHHHSRRSRWARRRGHGRIAQKSPKAGSGSHYKPPTLNISQHAVSP